MIILIYALRSIAMDAIGFQGVFTGIKRVCHVSTWASITHSQEMLTEGLEVFTVS